MKWRKQGDPAVPGYSGKSKSAKTRAPKDPTYGSEPDMLDKDGIIVEPDVRKKIASYFKDMGLREWVRLIIREEFRNE